MKWAVVFAALSTAKCLLGDGFCAGTHVKTPGGYAAIEQIKQKDLIIGFDARLGVCAPCIVNAINKKRVNQVIRLTTGGQELYVGCQQRFLCLNQRRNDLKRWLIWTKVRDLKRGMRLLSANKISVCVDTVQRMARPIDVYELSVAGAHTYIVTEHDLVAHNVAPIVIPFVYTVGEGVTIAWGAAAALLGYATIHHAVGNRCDTSGLCGPHTVDEIQNHQDNWSRLVRERTISADRSKLHLCYGGSNGGPDRNNKSPCNPNKGKNKNPQQPSDPNNARNKNQRQGPKNVNSRQVAAKERKFNTMERAEVFRKGKFKQDYKTCKNGRYVKKTGVEGFGKRAQYLEWDNFHKDMEMYDKFGRHQGCIEPITEKIYKPAVPGRTINVR